MQPTISRISNPTRRAPGAVLLAALLALLVSGGCSRAGEEVEEAPLWPKPVSGRVDTGAGVSIDFPEGWAEMSQAGRPYSRYYENKERQLALGVIDFPTDYSIWTLGEQVKRRLSHEATLEENGPVRVDGREAFRVVSALKTSTGHGLVVGLVVMRSQTLATSLFLSTTGDEREHHRAEMEALLATVRVT